MTTLERLDRWKLADVITASQHDMLSRLVRRELFSVFLELNALLYIGVIALVGGIGWTIQAHFTNLGDVFILAILSLALVASLYYCFSRGPAFSVQQVESPNFIFDYVLYLACLVLSVELGYIEFRFEWLRDAWENYLLVSSGVFFLLAYRFDNRFVLSLALSSLAGWFGLKVNRFGFISSESLRLAAITYAGVISAAGSLLFYRGIKRHFLETYLHVAANVVFLALISGISDSNRILFLGLLMAVAATSIVLGVRFNRFAFVVYGTVYGYAGISFEVLKGVHNVETQLLYVVVSASAVIVCIVMLARKYGRAG